MFLLSSSLFLLLKVQTQRGTNPRSSARPFYSRKLLYAETPAHVKKQYL